MNRDVMASEIKAIERFLCASWLQKLNGFIYYQWGEVLILFALLLVHFVRSP